MKFVVAGVIKGKARPRFSGRGGYVRTYTPETTRDYENLIRRSYTQQSNKKYEGALSIKIDAFFKKNKRNKKVANTIYVLKKPDGDNIVKVVLDALNGIAYDDDKQVSKIEITKLYSDDDNERLEIEINELEGLK